MARPNQATQKAIHASYASVSGTMRRPLRIPRRPCLVSYMAGHCLSIGYPDPNFVAPRENIESSAAKQSLLTELAMAFGPHPRLSQRQVNVWPTIFVPEAGLDCNVSFLHWLYGQ